MTVLLHADVTLSVYKFYIVILEKAWVSPSHTSDQVL